MVSIYDLGCVAFNVAISVKHRCERNERLMTLHNGFTFQQMPEFHTLHTSQHKNRNALERIMKQKQMSPLFLHRLPVNVTYANIRTETWFFGKEGNWIYITINNMHINATYLYITKLDSPILGASTPCGGAWDAVDVCVCFLVPLIAKCARRCKMTRE